MYMYRMAALLSTLPVGKEMKQLSKCYFSNMQMLASVRRYDTNLCHIDQYMSNTVHQYITVRGFTINIASCQTWLYNNDYNPRLKLPQQKSISNGLGKGLR